MTTEPTGTGAEHRGARGPQIRRPRRRGEERAELHQQLAVAYTGGASIRELAARHDLSYGLTRTLLLEAEVELRLRRRPRKAAGQ